MPLLLRDVNFQPHERLHGVILYSVAWLPSNFLDQCGRGGGWPPLLPSLQIKQEIEEPRYNSNGCEGLYFHAEKKVPTIARALAIFGVLYQTKMWRA